MEAHTSHKNTLGIVAFWLSIAGIILSFFVVGIPLLVISLILGIIAVFKKPRKAAVVSIILSGLPLLLMVICSALLWKPVVQPIVDFTKEIKSMANSNPEIKQAMEDPSFEKFFSYSLQTEFMNIDWQGLMDENSSWMEQTEKAVKTSLDIIKEKIPLAVTEWESMKNGNTLDNQNTTTNPLVDTAWQLYQYNGQAVSGTYLLDFTADMLSIQFCNRMSGSYTLSDNNMKISAQLISTEMACFDDEKMTLESAFWQMMQEASMSIASTRMAGDNNQRLALSDGEHTFLFVQGTLE